MYLCAELDRTDTCVSWVEYVAPTAGVWDELTYQDVGLLASAALMLYAAAWVVKQLLHFLKTI